MTDTTPPTFSEAEVDGTSLVSTFTEDLAAAASLSTNPFTVMKTPAGGITATANLTGTPSIRGRTLTLATAVVSSDTLTVSYEKPTAGTNNKLEDADGNEVASFPAQPVINNTPPILPPGNPEILVANAQVEEGPSAVLKFVVTLSHAARHEVTVEYWTVDGWDHSDGTGGADAGSDYEEAKGALRFASGETEKTVSVVVMDDTESEGNEILGLVLDHAREGEITRLVATGTILDSMDTPKPTPEPNAVPVFSDGARASRSVVENTDSGQDIGNPVTATDADASDTLTYTLGGTDAASFSIDASTGQLRTSAALDHERKSSYSVTVTADDGNGGSATIDVSISVTDVDEPPGTPSTPAVSADGSTSLSVSWNAPTNTGPAINDYDVRYKKSADTGWTDWPHSGTGTSAAITGLEAGTAYDVQVRASNAEGTGNWSATGSGSTDPSSPTPGKLAAPDNLTATVVSRVDGNTPNVIELLWNDPNNAAITGYQYRMKLKTDDTWEQWWDLLDADAETTNLKIGVWEDGTFLVELRAVDDSGPGATSQASFTID